MSDKRRDLKLKGRRSCCQGHAVPLCMSSLLITQKHNGFKGANSVVRLSMDPCTTSTTGSTRVYGLSNCWLTFRGARATGIIQEEQKVGK